MAKFLKRILNRRYKRVERSYIRFLLEFPAKLNDKLSCHEDKEFDEVEITSQETDAQEIVNISLVRNKPKK